MFWAEDSCLSQRTGINVYFQEAQVTYVYIQMTTEYLFNHALIIYYFVDTFSDPHHASLFS